MGAPSQSPEFRDETAESHSLPPGWYWGPLNGPDSNVPSQPGRSRWLWINPGSVTVVVGGALVFGGFIAIAMIASLTFTSEAQIQAYEETAYSLLGTGFLLVAVGWFVNQRYLFRRLLP